LFSLIYVVFSGELSTLLRQGQNNKNSDTKTVLELIWEEAPIPTVKRRYWQIAAELKGEKFEVVEAIGPSTPPQKSRGKSGNKSDVPRPVLKSEKIAVSPPILKSAKTAIDALEPNEIEASAQASANEAPEAEPITETASEPIAIGTSGEIEENNNEAKAIDISEGIASSEIKEIIETASELIAESPSESIEPVETEGSPVVAEPVTQKRKKAGSKSTASKKLSITEGVSEAITPENAELKKTKAKSSSSKKPMSFDADRLFLGKQLPPGK
jgi:hypothetical protein